MAESVGEPPGLRAVTRTLDLLDVIAHAEGRLDLSTLARLSGLHPATALRYLGSLEARGLIRRNAQSGYQLGARLFELGSAFARQSSFAEEAQPVLEDLARQLQETASAGLLEGSSILYIAIVQGQRELGIQSSPGVRHPAYCTSLGKAILAHTPWPAAKAVLEAEPLVRLTAKTLVDLPALSREFEAIRRQGFATDDEERHEGVICIGAPVFDHTDRVVGALSISGPAFRVARAQTEIAHAVTSASSTVSKRLGSPRRTRA
ncbi:MAG: IclR family transcriptional regulator, acetate operon repressor [Actinomycetota bacterium]|jgi:DNA-binding IclR family transcriptional regulator|nr:IclR family transcriptional regulator, acetate operon repressor [Actinomycetota bacterium]